MDFSKVRKSHHSGELVSACPAVCAVRVSEPKVRVINQKVRPTPARRAKHFTKSVPVSATEVVATTNRLFDPNTITAAPFRTAASTSRSEFKTRPFASSFTLSLGMENNTEHRSAVARCWVASTSKCQSCRPRLTLLGTRAGEAWSTASATSLRRGESHAGQGTSSRRDAQCRAMHRSWNRRAQHPAVKVSTAGPTTAAAHTPHVSASPIVEIGRAHV